MDNKLQKFLVDVGLLDEYKWMGGNLRRRTNSPYIPVVAILPVHTNEYVPVVEMVMN